MRVFLECWESWFELQPGETVLGRYSGCPIQLKDESLSRRHLRFYLDPQTQTVEVEDLMSTNGSKLNDVSLHRTRRLQDGDMLLAATSILGVHIVADDEPRAAQMGQWARRGRPAQDAPPGDRYTGPVAVCSQCGFGLAAPDKPCVLCEPQVEERADTTPPLDRRREPRIQLSLPVRYRSASARFSGCICDISMGGVFVASRRSEPPITSCRVTIKPESGQAFTAEGEVRHVVTEQDALGRPPGFGIKFTTLEYRGRQWIHNAIQNEMNWFHDTSPGA